jgi:hypothetical protein
MLVALVPVAYTLLANMGKIIPAGTVNTTGEASSCASTLMLPAPPTNNALTAPKSVESLGVTAASLEAENIAPGLLGVKLLAINTF